MKPVIFKEGASHLTGSTKPGWIAPYKKWEYRLLTTAGSGFDTRPTRTPAPAKMKQSSPDPSKLLGKDGLETVLASVVKPVNEGQQAFLDHLCGKKPTRAIWRFKGALLGKDIAVIGWGDAPCKLATRIAGKWRIVGEFARHDPVITKMSPHFAHIGATPKEREIVAARQKAEEDRKAVAGITQVFSEAPA